MSGSAIRPTWHRRFDENLGVDVARVVGYRAVAKDGWKGPRRYTFSEAREDLRERHRTVKSKGQRTEA